MKSPGFYSGVAGESIKRMNQFLGALGVKDSRAASPAEVFDALSNKVVLDGLGGSLGPGISNTDRDYISRTAPTLAQSEEGNKSLIGVARALAQRQKDVAQLAREYAAKNGGASTADSTRHSTNTPRPTRCSRRRVRTCPPPPRKSRRRARRRVRDRRETGSGMPPTRTVPANISRSGDEARPRRPRPLRRHAVRPCRGLEAGAGRS